jgi:hypothetical protein
MLKKTEALNIFLKKQKTKSFIKRRYIYKVK